MRGSQARLALRRKQQQLGLARALQLKVVICNSYSLEGLDETNATCSKCGKQVWCNPVWSEVEKKLCGRCGGLI
jgi:hypothetical protein